MIPFILGVAAGLVAIPTYIDLRSSDTDWLLGCAIMAICAVVARHHATVDSVSGHTQVAPHTPPRTRTPRGGPRGRTRRPRGGTS